MILYHSACGRVENLISNLSAHPRGWISPLRILFCQEINGLPTSTALAFGDDEILKGMCNKGVAGISRHKASRSLLL